MFFFYLAYVAELKTETWQTALIFRKVKLITLTLYAGINGKEGKVSR